MGLYQEHTPPTPLAPWVECAWTLESKPPLQAHRVPPDGCIDIIYDGDTGLSAIALPERTTS